MREVIKESVLMVWCLVSSLRVCVSSHQSKSYCCVMRRPSAAAWHPGHYIMVTIVRQIPTLKLQ